ncbi:MAG: multi-sensor signal transduction histidine kinase, partial [uncultured bacterium]
VANAYDVDGETVIQCNIRDITLRVVAERKVIWLASFPTLNPKPILEIDRVAGLVYVNPTAQRLFPDLDSLKMNHPYLKESGRFFNELNLPEKKTARREIEIGGRWYLQECNLVTPDRLRIYGSDITYLKKNERDLAVAKSYDEAVLNSISEGVVVCDQKGNITLFNKKSAELTGAPANEVMGNHYSKYLNFVKEVTGEPYNGFIVKVLSGHEVVKIEKQVLLVSRNGTKIPVDGSAAPIVGTNGMAYGLVIIFHDITQERSVDKAKTEFVSLASHQMRTPLTAINWYTELLQSEKHGPLNHEQTKFAAETYSASRRMSALVNSLLNVSRLEMGTFLIEPVLLNVVDLVETNLSLFKSQLLYKNLDFRKEYDPNMEAFLADPKLLSIIIQNLLSNAVKYTPSGGKIVLVVKKEADQLKISVSDTGAGIPKNEQGKIFGKLYRAENAKLIDPAGTGLGLYIVHEVVTNSGGSIGFESEEGKGSTFYVTFPLSGMIKKAGEKRII